MSKLYFENYGRYIFLKPQLSFFWKCGSTSAALNSALNILFSPLTYIFRAAETWGFTRYHLKYTIPNEKKLSKLRLSYPFFGLFLVISELGSRFYSEIGDFDFLSVSLFFFAWNHIVSHRQRQHWVFRTIFTTLGPLWYSEVLGLECKAHLALGLKNLHLHLPSFTLDEYLNILQKKKKKKQMHVIFGALVWLHRHHNCLAKAFCVLLHFFQNYLNIHIVIISCIKNRTWCDDWLCLSRKLTLSPWAF